MSAQQSDVPTETQGAEVEPTDGLLTRRALQLCRRAEPHADAAPCAPHLAEAHRQLLGLAD